MSFAADLKDFADNFRSTYKTFHVSGADEWASTKAAALRADEARRATAEARGDAAATGATANPLDRRAVDTGSNVDPATGYNYKGRLPTFAQNDPLDIMTRVVHGEASNTDPEEQKAIAATILNRAKASGKPIAAEVFAPNQFEAVWNPKNRARISALSPDSPEYQRARASVEAAVAGDDPTGGATHFYAPKAQSELGRATPTWARGKPFKDIGPTRFYKLPYGKQAALDPGYDPDADPTAAPVVYAATGGVIPTALPAQYDTTQVDNAGSNPAVRDVMDTRRAALLADDGGDEGGGGDDYDPRSLVDVEGARKAVAGGLKFGQRLLGLETHHAAIPEAAPINPEGVRALATNAGAATQEEKAVVDKTIDPKGQLPPELREVARYNAMYKYWNSIGEPEKANRAAWGMINAAKMAAAQYGVAALAVDDPVKRAEIIAKGYTHLVPDGNTMNITGKAPDGGAKFEVVDPNGKITEKGALAVDDMIQLATGMVNGTQTLQSLLGFATSAPTAAEKKVQRNQVALNQFDAEQPEDDIIMSRLTEKQRDALTKMDPDVRARTLEAERKKFKLEYTAEQDALKRDDKIENRDYNRDWQQFKTALAQNNFDVKRHDVLTNAEKKFFLYEKDLDDRNKRFDQSQEARKQRDATRAQQLLESRVGRAAAQGIKLTAKERQAQDAEAARVGQEQAVDTNMPLTPGGSEGTMEERRQRDVREATLPLRAETSFQSARERQLKYGGKSEIAADDTAKAVTDYWTNTLKKPADQLTTSKRDTLANIAGGIATANPIDSEQAIRTALAASDVTIPIKFVTDPSDPRGAQVQIGTSTPLRLGRDTLNMIALARGEGRDRGLNPTPYATPEQWRTHQPGGGARTALPGVTGNPSRPAAESGWLLRDLRGARKRALAAGQQVPVDARRALDTDMIDAGMFNPMYRP